MHCPPKVGFQISGHLTISTLKSKIISAKSSHSFWMHINLFSSPYPFLLWSIFHHCKWFSSTSFCNWLYSSRILLKVIKNFALFDSKFLLLEFEPLSISSKCFFFNSTHGLIPQDLALYFDLNLPCCKEICGDNQQPITKLTQDKNWHIHSNFLEANYSSFRLSTI